ncbi:hypothetical protein JCM19294_779 [Nonlabens tegetincola]|uniref:TerB family tellurite resistance protein n=2 Tax=Nonlabens tegetincola TaxID=323273 RepID=A0A090QRN0_9FLAO|nr:hypothetical protein JCM19294_779 [Nonlabens tegetincola]
MLPHKEIMGDSTTLKKDLLNQLILMAHRDGKLDSKEISFVLNVGKRLGFEEVDVVDMIKNPSAQIEKPPKDFTQRIVHFHRLMIMMYIDGHVDDKELQFLYELGLTYGFRKSTIDTLLKMMERYPNGDIPASELIEIHSRDYN